ncbi:DUF951 domain-containing protein [Anaerolineales bacterium HSG25]|nr:DUF951 domain-containing protein [Anaerolineales bacterium HSG25]
MSRVNSADIQLDTIVRLRKKHPCGSTDWRIVRVGADIGLLCLTCKRKLLVPRGKLLKQIKHIVTLNDE